MKYDIVKLMARRKIRWKKRWVSGDSGGRLTFRSKKAGRLSDYRIYGNTVGGESVGDRTGNLFDEINGVVTDEYIQDNGTININPNGDRYICNRINVLPNTTYTFSWGKMVLGTNNYPPYIRVAQYDSNGNFISRILVKANDFPNNRWVTTVENDVRLWDIRIDDVSSTRGQHLEEIMLNSGSTPLPYEPYGYKVPVMVEGKNLFDLNTWANTIRSISGDGVMSISGSTVSITSINAADCYTEPYANSQTGVYKMSVKPNTNYTVNWYGSNYRIMIFENGIFDYTYNFFSDTPQSFTTHSDTTFLTIRFGVNPTNPLGTTATISEFIISEGSEPIPYEPYHAPVTTPIYLPEPIKMVGDEAEYIDYSEQKQHRVRKNLLNILANTTIVDGIHFTVNSDKSLTIDGNLDASKSDLYLIVTDSLILDRGEYLVSCENASTNAKFIIGGSPSTGYVPYTEIIDSNSVEVSCSGGGIGFCLIRVTSDIETPITLYPMIRKADISDDTYEPYIENTDLDVTLPALPTLTETNVLSVGTAVQPSRVEVKGRIKAVG